jgi:plastocyanin
MMSSIGLRSLAGSAVAALLATSCGSSGPTSPSGAPHTLPSTIMIMGSEALPQELTIAIGERVAFMNHDTVPHAVAGGPDPSRPDCPEINAVGVLAPGDTRSTEPFTTAKTCAFHVPRNQSALLAGRIIIR